MRALTFLLRHTNVCPCIVFYVVKMKKVLFQMPIHLVVDKVKHFSRCRKDLTVLIVEAVTQHSSLDFVTFCENFMISSAQII